MDKISERISKLRKKLGLTQAEFAGELGIGARTYARYEASERDIPSGVLLEIAKMGNVSMDWLIIGKNNIVQEPTPAYNMQGNVIHIPYYDGVYAAAGYGAHNGDTAVGVMSFDPDFLRAQLGIASFKGLHIITAIGDSMIPTLLEGELLFILPFESENGDIRDNGIYVIQTPNGTMVKRIALHPLKRSYTLRSDNKTVEDILIEGDEIDACRIIGRVVAHFDRV